MTRVSPAAAAICLIVSLGAMPGPARSQDLPVTECATSPATLAVATEGVAYNASVLTSTSPALAGLTASNLPPGLALVDRYLRGTPSAPGTYSVGLRKAYRNACGKAMPQKPGEDAGGITTISAETISLKVRDTHAPTITGFVVTPDTLGYAGGTLTLRVQATDNVAVTRVLMTTVHPDGHSGSAPVPMSGGTAANGTWSITFALGANATGAPVSYTFTVSASDADGNAAKAGPKTVVVAAHAAQPLTPLQIKRP